LQDINGSNSGIIILFSFNIINYIMRKEITENKNNISDPKDIRTKKIKIKQQLIKKLFVERTSLRN
jgi:hypothetical protein